MNDAQYTLIKIPIKEIIAHNYHVQIDRAVEIEKEYLITQGNSPFFDQIERLRGKFASHISEVILVVAKKNPKQESELRHLLADGFYYNDTHYSRFGKSASQGKDGITAFVCDAIFEELYKISQMDLTVDECVISKYESQRCLLFSSCTLLPDYVPNIVIIGEYQKTLAGQLIKYVVEKEREFTDEETNETRTYKSREITEGYQDITLSPFDGCGCHETEFMAAMSEALALTYSPIGAQVRMPFMKGYSVYVPFRTILKEWGCESITDIYGHSHPIDTIDCIWNTSMFKGHKLFFSAYGQNAWNEYMNTFKKYHFKLGISKYCHHIKQLNKKNRMNFQYLQCLDLWNPKYIAHYEDHQSRQYNILAPENQGKMISLAAYTTDLYEKIIRGDKFYTYKFMGMTDTDDYEPESKYLEAVLANDVMLHDPAVKQFLYRKLKKAIQEAKVGKIYADGLYHTIVGDMIGYLEYAAGREPTGCLNAHEFFCGTMANGECLSLRSPLVCPSEVNKVALVSNAITEKWFSHFKDQDIAMLNMYDLSLPQQGGADCDGDIMFLCNHPLVVQSKIEKPIVIDIDDKTMASPKPYTKENLIEYEVMTRDNRIGEITNAATSIENKYTTNEEVKALYADYASLLRLFQGHEIDFLKTGTRWHMNRSLRNHLKQLPYFLLYNYPGKMKTYEKLKEANRLITDPAEKYPLNAYYSPSPMNELCDYICTWEKKNILWNNSTQALADTSALVMNQQLNLQDRKIMRRIRHYINDYALDIRRHMNLQKEKTHEEYSRFHRETLIRQYRQMLLKDIPLSEELIANYVIKVSYGSLSISKALAWSGYGDYIVDNIRRNSPAQQPAVIVETADKTADAYEYLGKYYKWKEDGIHE